MIHRPVFLMGCYSSMDLLMKAVIIIAHGIMI